MFESISTHFEWQTDMLNQNGFDLWADGYDKSVRLSEEAQAYPFAGYKNLLNEIYNRILSRSEKEVLDIGFGTGTLTCRLYEQGYRIYGQDFSEKMIGLAQKKMPEARLYQGDFSKGLTEELRNQRYDAVIATYSLHHLTDAEKVHFLKDLIPLLKEGGHIYIGDVAFQTRAELEQCRSNAGEEWDEDEIYFVFEELEQELPGLKFERISDCAGVLEL